MGQLLQVTVAVIANRRPSRINQQLTFKHTIPVMLAYCRSRWQWRWWRILGVDRENYMVGGRCGDADAGCIMEYGCLMLVMIIATLSPAFLCITCRAPLLHFLHHHNASTNESLGRKWNACQFTVSDENNIMARVEASGNRLERFPQIYALQSASKIRWYQLHQTFMRE